MVVWVLFNLESLEIKGRYYNKVEAVYDCKGLGGKWRVIKEETLKKIF